MEENGRIIRRLYPDNMRLKSKSLCYVSMIIIGYILAVALPMSDIVGISPFTLMCALFIGYFGLKKILLIYFAPKLIHLLIAWPYLFGWLTDTAHLINSIMADNASPLRIDPVLFAYFNTISVLTQSFIMLIVTHWLLNRAGVFRRIVF